MSRARRIRVALAGLGLGAGLAAPVPAGEEAFWLVDPEQAVCLAAALPSYRQRLAAPMLIYLYDCPGNDPAEAFALMQQNTALPRGDDAGAGGGTDAILVFRPEEFLCLTADQFDFTARPVRVPKHPVCK